jgi:hypothetical protein
MTRISIVAAFLGICILATVGWLTLGGGGESPRPVASRSAASVPSGSAPAPTAKRDQARSGPAWPYAKLITHLEGKRLVVGRRTVRLDRGLLICSGRGAVAVRGGTRRWRRFICTQTTFANGVDRDISFDVAVTSSDRLVTRAERYGPN